ncbi:MAG: hypothetical protein IPP69_07015 [Flavobacteriales bacterium]|jgi:hypothetical protein|nr:hypothetical protein [Flavobacteriales bacterium]
MKALAITLVMLITVFQSQAGVFSTEKRKPKDVSKEQTVKNALDKQVNRHIYYPSQGESMEGKADVMLQMMPEGDVQVVLIQTANPLMKKFIERQVRKMKVDKQDAISGQIFKYRFVFVAKN